MEKESGKQKEENEKNQIDTSKKETDKKEKKEEVIDINDLEIKILPDDYEKYDLSYKVTVLGDSGVGKSCLTMRATKGLYKEFHEATVGFEFFLFNVQIGEKIIRLQIWDTCGQEIYKSVISSFYRNSSLSILVYSIDSLVSFNNLDSWLKELKSQIGPEAKLFLIGNKIDLPERQVQKEKATEYYKNNDFDYFNETSAKNGTNVQEIFIEAAKILYKEHLTFKNDARRQSIKKRAGRKLTKSKVQNRNKSCC